MVQRQRGLIPTLFDPAAVDPEPILVGTRLYECPYVTAAPRSFAKAAVEGTQTVDTLTIGNPTPDAGEQLDWTITEAQSDCSSPSDVSWFSAGQTSGTTASGASTSVTLTFSAFGQTAPSKLTALLCLASNDAGEALIAIPVTLQVEYPFGGFQRPLNGTAALNSRNAGSTIPVKFSLGGDRGLDVPRRRLAELAAGQLLDAGADRPGDADHDHADLRPGHRHLPLQLEDGEVVGRHVQKADGRVRRRDRAVAYFRFT